MNIAAKITFALCIFMCFSFNLFSQNQLFINSNATLMISQNAIVSAPNLIINNSGTINQQNNSILSVSRDFTNNGTYTTNNSTLLFNGIIDQNLNASSNQIFYILSVNKTNGQLEFNIPIRINNSLRIISNSIVDLNSNNLTIAPDGKITSNDGTDDAYDSFSEIKGIVNSGSSTDVFSGAYLIKEINPSSITPFELQFPISTPGTFSPVKIRFLSGGANFGTNPIVKVKPIPQTHPEAETPNVSLTKYIVVETDDITINQQGADIYGIYDEEDVQGNEGIYIPLLYAPNYNNPSGYWRPSPGITNYVNFNFKVWYAQKISIIEGDWTLGEPSAGRATYYARSSGDYNDTNTWSKTYFDGAPSNTIPNKRSDRIRIQNHTVTISTPIAEANLISVETGTEGRTSGILKITNQNICRGDSFKIQNNAKLFIAHTDGISDLTGLTGAIQTNYRNFANNAIYHYWGNQNQISGLGLPDNIKTLVIEKSTNSKVTLSKNTTISDSLIIFDGSLDLSTNSLNGFTANRKMVMFGGELIIRTNFPLNYTAPVFNFGQITFDGVGNAVIPSSGSTPGVIQYNKLNIKGTRSGNITFESSGEIKLINDFDISQLIFENNTFGFLTAGSSVRFAKNGGNQNINFTPQAPIDNAVNLKFYNLTLDSIGTKTITGLNSGIFTVVNDVKINNTASFVSNNHNIEVQGSWINLSGKFLPDSSYYVKMFSPTATVSKYIVSRDTTDNPFEDLIIQGPGIIEPSDNLKVLGNLTITSNANFKVTNVNLFLYGNWSNQGGSFTHTNSTAYFQGEKEQFMSKVSGDETFNNLTLRNPAHLNTNGIGVNTNSGLIITNNLSLTFGRINGRDRYVQVNGNLTRSGGGYINSRLRRNMDAGTNERTYEVGYEKSYTPVTVKFTGAGGTAGIVQVLADTLTTSTNPAKWADGTPSALNPLGSKLSPSKHIARQWTMEIPQGSTFVLGGQRKFKFTPKFFGTNHPNGDLRNGTNTTLLDVNVYNGSNWIYPLYYGTVPFISDRYSDSITYSDLTDFGTFVVGEPSTLTFYSRGSGNWTNRSNWSLVYYNGIVSNEYPGETTTNFIAYIGANHQITLDSNRVVNDNSTLEGYIAVDSTGILDLRQNIISGSGDFRMYRNSTIMIQDPNGITASTALGNIRTSNRYYNIGSHNSGTFIYYYNGAQNSGDGIPGGLDSVNVVIADNQSGTLTLNSSGPINLRDSLYIKSGNINSGTSNITLGGNLRINNGSSFIHNNRTFTFSGIKRIQYVFAPAASITFYNLNLSKNRDSSFVKFNPTAIGNSYNIQILNNLNFEANNKAFFDLSSTYNGLGLPDYNSGEWYMTIVNPGTVTRTGAGHVDGEMRKYVPSGSLANEGVRFEVGGFIFYRPFLLDLTGTSGTAGYVGVHSIYKLHPYSNELDDPFYSLTPERMIPNYWRITRPVSSPTTFSQGSRTMDMTVFYANPEDIPPGALVYCFDLAFWKGGATTNWQRLSPPNNNFNNGSGSTCGDRNVNANEATYSPNATLTSTEAYSIASSRPLSNQNLGLFYNNRYLLADVIIGQQGPGLTKFYSAKSGDWTDPSTWYTGGYNSGINENGGYPRERLHVANIGEGHTVRLNANLGNSWPDNGVEFLEQRLGSVIIEETPGGRGHLDLGTFVIRAAVFQLKNGGVIESGTSDGFHIQLNRGNIIQQYNGSALARDYNFGDHDNGNYIFTPNGINSTTYLNSDYRYCQPRFSTGEGRINSISAATGTPYNATNVIATYTDNQNSTNGHRYFPYHVFWLEAGQTYTFRMYLGGTTSPTNYRGHLFFDHNFNGSFSGENMSDGQRFNTSFFKDITFTVPANAPQGTTEIRAVATNYSTYTDPCMSTTSYYGEVEDYTVYVKNPNYTITQYTGAAIPAQIGSVTVNADSTGQYVEQNSNLSLKDSLLLKAGRFSTSTNAMKLQGDLINNAGVNALVSTVGGIEFNGNFNQYIRGIFNTNIYNLTLSNNGNSVILDRELTVKNLLSFTKDCKLDVEKYDLILDTNALQMTSINGNFSANRMITSLGTLSSKGVIKYFNSGFGVANPKSYYFPIGYASNFNPASVFDTISTFISKPSFNVKIIGQKHPAIIGNNALGIYWKVNSSFSTLDSMKFWYQPSDVNADSLRYIPGVFIGGKWKIDVGDNPWAKSSPIRINNTPRVNGDWTAAYPKEFADGYIYYSRNTGNWSNPKNWSTDDVLRHNGEPTSYFPGFLFTSDTINIDGHSITFDLDSVRVDSIRIGGTNSIPTTGKLIFGNNIDGKKLTLSSIFLDNDNGSIEATTGLIKDTIEIYKNFINNSAIGVSFSDPSGVHSVNLNFVGSGESNINGTGLWKDIREVYLNKVRGFLDTLKINSTSYSVGSITSEPKFYFNNGILLTNSSTTTLIANNSHSIELLPYTGIISQNGDVLTNNGLLSNANSLIKLNGSNIFVGNGIDENYSYYTGTDFQILKGKFHVGGSFVRKNLASTIDLVLTDSTEIMVAKYGSTSTDPSFDLRNNGSLISMSGGRIIVANGNPNTNSDLTINAERGLGISGGVIQIGDTTYTTTGNNFRIGGITSIFDLHLVENPAPLDYTTSIETLTYKVKNNILIDSKQKLDLNGNILELQGNLTNYGEVLATPSTPTGLPWQFLLTGEKVQYFKNYNLGLDYLEIFNLSLNKTNGKLILGDTLVNKSSLKINEMLDYSLDNLSFIDANSYLNKVIIGPNNSTIGQSQISRANKGHVFGPLLRFAENGTQSLLFTVGADTLNSYRPVILDIEGTSNTPGYIEVTPYNVIHPDISSSELNPVKSIPRYWTVEPAVNNPFSLGIDGLYDITTQFVNPGDVPPTANTGIFEHNIRVPSYPQIGQWFNTIFAANTSTAVKSRDMNQWGDIIVGEPLTTTFYSISSGNWQDINSWSLSGYNIPNPPSRIPDQNTDIVRIGNGKEITLQDDGTNPLVRTVIIEKFNNLPGTLQVVGSFNYFSGTSFSLEDGCTLGMEHIDGIRPESEGAIGAVQTNVREFGIGRYIYNSKNGSQVTGNALPDYVQSLIIDNSSATTNKKVFLSNYPGAPTINISDSLFIRQGIFNGGNRNLRICGNIVLDSIENEGSFEPLNGKITLDSLSNHNIILKNHRGLTLFDIDLKTGDAFVSREGNKVTSATNLFVNNNLHFGTGNMLILGDSTHIIINSTNQNAITNYSNEQFIRTSHSSGMLIRHLTPTGAPKNYIYPIGSFENGTENYTPLILNIESGNGNAQLGVRVSPGNKGGFPGGHMYIRNSIKARYLKRFWMIDSVNGDFNALGRFFYNQADVYGFEREYNRLGRWRPQGEGYPGQWFVWENPVVDSTQNFFETNANMSSDEFTGDWTIGNPFAFMRIFFSRQSGIWSDPNSWTENENHIGPIFGMAEWPDGTSDSVVIGGGDGIVPAHEITLDRNTIVRGYSLGTGINNRGILNTLDYLVQGSYFTMAELSHLKIGSPDGIYQLGNNLGSIRSSIVRQFNPDGIYEYNGNLNQSPGNGLPNIINTLIINNSGIEPNNQVLFDRNIDITNNLNILRGRFNIQDYSVNNSTGIGTFNISNLGRIIIGGNKNLKTSVDNYSTYNFNTDSYVEFNGSLVNTQVINLLPANALNGIGNLDLTNPGTKIVDGSLLIRGNLRNFNPARLEVNRIDALMVRKNVINESAIYNAGIIEIGE